MPLCRAGRGAQVSRLMALHAYLNNNGSGAGGGGSRAAEDAVSAAQQERDSRRRAERAELAADVRAWWSLYLPVFD